MEDCVHPIQKTIGGAQLQLTEQDKTKHIHQHPQSAIYLRRSFYLHIINTSKLILGVIVK